ncbi:MAG: hypothetical protein PVJ92_01110, partial [Candidatus Dependentiae bacterium]
MSRIIATVLVVLTGVATVTTSLHATDYFRRNYDGSLAEGITVAAHELHVKRNVPVDISDKIPAGNGHNWSMIFNTHRDVEGNSWNTLSVAITGKKNNNANETFTVRFDPNYGMIDYQLPSSAESNANAYHCYNSHYPNWRAVIPDYAPYNNIRKGILFNTDQNATLPYKLKKGIDKHDYWITLVNGLIGFGHGNTPGENTMWAWRIDSTRFTATSISLSVDRFDALIGPPAGQSSHKGPKFVIANATLGNVLQRKLDTLVGGKEPEDLASLTYTYNNTEYSHNMLTQPHETRRTLATVRTLAGYENPENFVREGVVTIKREEQMSLKDRLPTNKNRWAMRFKTEGASPPPLEFMFTTSDGKKASAQVGQNRAMALVNVPAESKMWPLEPSKGDLTDQEYSDKVRQTFFKKGAVFWIPSAGEQVPGL